MPEYKVLIADSRYESYYEEMSVLSKIDAEIVYESSDNEDKIAAAAADADGLIVNLAPITARVIAGMRKCKCVSRYGVGYDNVDAQALKEKGIYLANVPDYCGEDVSDHAMALLMDCIRKISLKDRHVRNGEWNLTGLQKVFRTAGKTMGFVGFGYIARMLHRKLQGFNLGRVLVSDPIVTLEQAMEVGVELVDLHTLCREADFISLHAPLLPGTRGMIGEQHFDLMKETAIIVNTSRGQLIDEGALVRALDAGKIACAGLDVFSSEPLAEGSELRKLDNVTLTDHTGWYSEEAIADLKTKAAQNIVDTLKDGRPRYEVKIG